MGLPRWLNAPNLFTSLRMFATPAIVFLIAHGQHLWGGWLFGAAATTDILDGAVARLTRSSTRVGQYLDPIADKVLMGAVYLALGYIGSIPWWFVMMIFARDIALVVASAIAMRVSSYNDYTPTIWGKLSTFFQVMTAVAVLAANAYESDFFRAVGHLLLIVSTVSTGWSAVHYTWRGVTYFTRRRGHGVSGVGSEPKAGLIK